jgi:hypothetical protein
VVVNAMLRPLYPRGKLSLKACFFTIMGLHQARFEFLLSVFLKTQIDYSILHKKVNEKKKITRQH